MGEERGEEGAVEQHDQHKKVGIRTSPETSNQFISKTVDLRPGFRDSPLVLVSVVVDESIRAASGDMVVFVI